MSRVLSLMERVFESALEEERQRLDVSLNWSKSIKRLMLEDAGTFVGEQAGPEWLTRRELRERDLMAEVKAALKRLDEGKYGHCDLCREPIELDHLLEVPWARYCAGCLADSGVLTAPISVATETTRAPR